MSHSKVTDRGASGNQTIPPRSFAAFLCNKCILDRTETGASEVDNLMINETPSLARMGKPKLLCLITSCCAVLLFLMTVLPAIGRAQTQEQAKPAGSEPSPERAVPAILAAFDKYEVVGMPEAHGFKDQDDFILSLIRTPAFPKKVN